MRVIVAQSQESVRADGIYLGVNTFMGYINEKGQSAYNTAFYALAKDPDPETAPKELKESAELFRQVIDKYGMSKVSRLALPELAYLKVLEKKYDEAIPLYERFLNEVSDNAPYQSLARLALAACYEAKGDMEKAIQTLNQITTGPDALFKEQAMLGLARVYRLADQKDKSKEILQEFVENYQNSPNLPLAKTHLNEYHP